ncbi:PLC-like phosphodiesterase, partial [Clohesyomyces aquaticus]
RNLLFTLSCSCLLPGTIASTIPEVSNTLQNILKNTDKSNKYTYPTDLTRGIIPKPFHSHNDYWRDVPFYTGLSYGAISTESDVWLINGTLYVGHELSALTPERTFESLYINPILDTLHRQNPITKFAPSPTLHGVFDADSGQTLYLFVDLKTSGSETWPAVLKALEPLRAEKYLSTYDGKTFTSAPVTVIGTGNTPLSAVQSAIPRDAFYDAPLPTLSTTFSNITSFDSPIASTDFAVQFGKVLNQTFNSTQLDTLREQVATAHAKGIKVRYWDQPGWPIGTRNAVWRTLIDEGVDILNVDDLKGCAEFWENRG